MNPVETPASRAPGNDIAALLAKTEWPVALSILAYGVRVGVRVNDAALAAEVKAHLPPTSETRAFSEEGQVYSLLFEAEEGGERHGALYVGDKIVRRRQPLVALLRTFEAQLQMYVAEMAPERVFVHAGVVGWQGRGILLPGRSFSGKTTLVAELLRAGAEYFSDEYAVLDSDGRVHPYPRRLSIREGPNASVIRRRVDALGGREAAGPAPVSLILVTTFRAGAIWQPRPLSAGNGALALVANTVPAQRIPERMLATLERVVGAARVLTSDRGEAAGVARLILDLASSGEIS